MAARGASASKIARKTGVRQSSARKIVQRTSARQAAPKQQMQIRQGRPKSSTSANKTRKQDNRTVSRKTQKSTKSKKQSTQQASNNWQDNPILRFASGRDRNADYNQLLSSRNLMGAFDGAAWARAQAAGYSDDEIRAALESYRQGPQGSLMIGVRPEAVLNNWQNMNPELYRQFAQGPAAQFSAPGQVLFNPLGETNIGLGRGGLQDRGITWYSTQGNADNDLSQGNMPVSTARNVLESGYYLNTPEGRQRMMIGESPVPGRYMGDPKTGRPSSAPGSRPFGYNAFTSPSAQAYQANLGYQGSWMPQINV